MSRHAAIIALLVLIGVALAACASQEALSSSGPNLAAVDEIEIRAPQPPSGNQEIEVWAYGVLPNPCSKIGDMTEGRDGSTIILTLTTIPSNRAGCETDRVAEFIQIIPIDFTELETGEYIVVVNGVRGKFAVYRDDTVDK